MVKTLYIVICKPLDCGIPPYRMGGMYETQKEAIDLASRLVNNPGNNKFEMSVWERILQDGIY